MKLNASGFLRKCQFPAMLLLGALPLLAIVALQNAPQVLPELAVQTLTCLALCEISLVMPGKVRAAFGLLGCAALIAQGVILFPIAQCVFLALIPMLLAMILYYSLQFAAWPPETEIAFGFYAAGVFAHLLAQLVARAAQQTGLDAWVSVTPLLTCAFALFLLLVLFSMNRTTMSRASLGRQRIPAAMRRRNTVVTVSLLLLALIIAGIPAIIRFVERVWSLFLHTVGAILAFIARLLEDDVPAGSGFPGGNMDMMPGVPNSEPSLLALILEKILTVLALGATALLVCYLLRILFKKAIVWIRRLLLRMSQYMNVVSQDYVDEITDTRESGDEAAGTLLYRIRRRLVDERNLTPNERIRARYRALQRRHPDWAPSRTARENLPPNAAALYEAARYSGQEATQEDAKCFIAQCKKGLPG